MKKLVLAAVAASTFALAACEAPEGTTEVEATPTDQGGRVDTENKEEV